MSNLSHKIDFLNIVCLFLPRHFSLEVQHFIACHFALESDFGDSPSACCSKNFCGMRVPALRATLCLNPDKKGEFAEYGGIGSCVYDYVIWLVSERFTRQDYNNLGVFIKHFELTKYSDDFNYLDKILSIYNQFYSKS